QMSNAVGGSSENINSTTVSRSVLDSERVEVMDDDMDEPYRFTPPGCPEDIRPTSRSSVKRICRVISKMSEEKREYVKEIGFGGILHLPQLNKIDRSFTVWLMRKVDCNNREIIVSDNIQVTMEDKDVHRVLGIPRGKKTVHGLGTNNPEEKFHFIEHAIGAEEDESRSLLAASINVETDKPGVMTTEDVKHFKVSFVVWLIGYFLAPTRKCNHGSNDFWGSLLDPDDIVNYNWCKYALDMLVEAARAVQLDLKTRKTCSYVSGCPLLLQIIYLDNVNLGPLNRPLAVSPCVAGLTCEIMRKMILAAKATSIGRPNVHNARRPTPSFQHTSPRQALSDRANKGKRIENSTPSTPQPVDRIETACGAEVDKC
ncbi:hypothetical protein E2562_036302, partial [Oryza meyeriana var. granulata]